MPKSKYSKGSKSGGTKRGVGKFTPTPPKAPKTMYAGYMDGRPSKGDLNQTFKG